MKKDWFEKWLFEKQLQEGGTEGGICVAELFWDCCKPHWGRLVLESTNKSRLVKIEVTARER